MHVSPLRSWSLPATLPPPLQYVVIDGYVQYDRWGRGRGWQWGLGGGASDRTADLEEHARLCTGGEGGQKFTLTT